MAAYRSGRYRQAVPLLEQAVARPWVNKSEREAGPALARFFLAMAHHQMRESDEARRLLAEATKSIDRAAARERTGDAWLEWPLWAACQVVRSEAETLIRKAP